MACSSPLKLGPLCSSLTGFALVPVNAGTGTLCFCSDGVVVDAWGSSFAFLASSASEAELVDAGGVVVAWGSSFAFLASSASEAKLVEATTGVRDFIIAAASIAAGSVAGSPRAHPIR